MSATITSRSSSLIRVALWAALASSVAFAQQAPRIIDTNAHTWLVFSADQALRGRWGAHTEINVRRSNVLGIWHQLQFHGAATYRVTPRVQAAAAFIWMRSYPYGDFPVAQNSVERRTHEQLSIRQATWKGLDFDHRIRLDQRWLQQYSPAGLVSWRYENRARYQFRAVLPLAPVDSRGRQAYLLAADEVLYHLPPKRGATYFNQNRAIVGFGQRLGPSDRIEFHYLHQFLYQRNGRVVESNHTVRIQFSTTSPLFWRRRGA